METSQSKYELRWNLESIMKMKKLDIEEVSKITDLHRNIISKIKNNKQKRVDLETIEKLINGLNITPNDLFTVHFKNE